MTFYFNVKCNIIHPTKWQHRTKGREPAWSLVYYLTYYETGAIDVRQLMQHFCLSLWFVVSSYLLYLWLLDLLSLRLTLWWGPCLASIEIWPHWKLSYVLTLLTLILYLWNNSGMIWLTWSHQCLVSVFILVFIVLADIDSKSSLSCTPCSFVCFTIILSSKTWGSTYALQGTLG